MRKTIYIGCGAFLGAVLRYLVKGVQITGYHGNIPLNTLFVNVVGAFVMALILTTAFEVWTFDADLRLGVTTGFLGAFTTFSTFCKETVSLLYGGDVFFAVLYMIISIVLGLAAAYFGVVAAREIIQKVSGEKESTGNTIEKESDVD